MELAGIFKEIDEETNITDITMLGDVQDSVKIIEKQLNWTEGAKKEEGEDIKEKSQAQKDEEFIMLSEKIEKQIRELKEFNELMAKIEEAKKKAEEEKEKEEKNKEIDQKFVETLKEMGFAENDIMQALKATNNSTVEEAVRWIIMQQTEKQNM